jgi:hypothetical protein
MMVVDYVEQIRQRAYAIWQARVRDGEPGDAVTDWLEAEAEVGAELMADRSA